MIEGLRTPLWKHQREAIEHARERIGSMLAIRMGGGKTLTTIALLHEWDARRVLVATPLSVVSTWPRELSRHSEWHWRVAALASGSVARRTAEAKLALDTAAARGDRAVVVINHESLWRAPFCELAMSTAWDVIVVDELHRAKAAGGKLSRFLADLGRRHPTARRLGLTGTPMPHSPIDLYAQARFLDPSIYGTSFQRFKMRYCNTPEAPIWMADFSFKPLGEIRVGDLVMGWETVNGRRRIAPSRVDAISRRQAESVVLVTMKSGRRLRCTPDHLWLSAYHGGTGQDPNGPWINVAAETRIERMKKPLGLCQVCAGPCPRKSHRGPHPLYCSRRCESIAFNTRKKRGGAIARGKRVLSFVIEPTPALTDEQRRAAIWLAGMYDGEGHGNTICQSQSHNPEVCEKIGKALDMLAIPWKKTPRGYTITGGRQSLVNFLNWTRGDLVRSWWIERILFGSDKQTAHQTRKGGRRAGNRQLHRTPDPVVSVVEQGPGEVIGLQTSTGNYVAWGYASKNCLLGGYEGREVVGFQRQDELMAKFRRFAFVANEKNLLDLPPELDVEIGVKLEPHASKVYRSLERDFWVEVEAGTVTASNALVKLLRLQQLTSGVLRLDDGAGDQSISDAKAEALASILADLPRGEKVVVFGRFTADIETAWRVAESEGRRFGEVSGRRKDLDHGRFPENVDVLGVNIQAGGVGIDLTRSSVAVFISCGFSLGDYLQARARLARPKQERSVSFIHLVASGTIDERVFAALRSRQKVVDALLARNSVSAECLRATG